MKKIILIISTFLLLLILSEGKAHAAGNIAGNSAVLMTASAKKEDPRVEKLRAYLKKYNSPMVDSAETFISEADKNNLDWRFVAAISGIESGFGKRIPVNSYNGWGYGIYGGNVKRFASWDEAIVVISSDIRVKYMNKWGAKDIYAIGRIYAANPEWANRVIGVMNKIEAYEPAETLDTLPISI